MASPRTPTPGAVGAVRHPTPRSDPPPTVFVPALHTSRKALKAPCAQTSTSGTSCWTSSGSSSDCGYRRHMPSETWRTCGSKAGG